jgi:superfamily II DNA or RNA helicase
MPQGWTYIVNKIEKDPARLKLIAKEAIKDMNAGHLVLIPFSRVPVITALTKAINQMVGKDVAASFYGGLKKDMRKTVIDRARNYKVKILVGNIRLLSTGINIPRASMFYQCTPASNIPRAEQKFARVLTPFDGKPEPGIKYFLDDVQVVKSCMRKEHWQCLVPRFRPRMTGEVRDVITTYLNGKKKQQNYSSYSGGGGRL